MQCPCKKQSRTPGEGLQPSPDAAPDSGEGFAALLRAIEGTAIAERLQRGHRALRTQR